MLLRLVLMLRRLAGQVGEDGGVGAAVVEGDQGRVASGAGCVDLSAGGWAVDVRDNR
jgi:hypothetical protein